MEVSDFKRACGVIVDNNLVRVIRGRIGVGKVSFLPILVDIGRREIPLALIAVRHESKVAVLFLTIDFKCRSATNVPPSFSSGHVEYFGAEFETFVCERCHWHHLHLLYHAFPLAGGYEVVACSPSSISTEHGCDNVPLAVTLGS